MGSQTNLIVNYLPQQLTDEEFRSMFTSIGPINSCKIVRDRMTGYSYGFGFVDFVNDADAQRAIDTLNGLQLQAKTLKVAYSRQGEDIKGANLYVRNIPKSMTKEELNALFIDCGKIVQCRVLTDPITGSSKGVGFVLYDQRSEAEDAIKKMNGKVPPGGTEPISVKFAEDNRGKARPPITPPGRGGGYGGMGGGGGGYGPGPMRNQGGRFRYNPMTGNYGPNPGPNQGIEPGVVLFVYNIGLEADERALWQLFSPFGSIQKVNVIWDYQKNQCKGYGFVTMTNYHEALNAIQGLNGYRYPGSGKQLQVSFKSNKG